MNKLHIRYFCFTYNLNKSICAHLELKPQPCVDAPLFVDVAAEAPFHFAIEAAVFTQFDIRPQPQLEPGITVIIMLAQYIVSAAGVRGQLQVTLTGKFVQQIGFQIDITAVFDLLTHNETDTPDSAVHAIDVPVSAPVGSVADAAQTPQGELRLRLEEQALLIIKALAIFYADAVSVFLITGFIRVVAVGPNHSTRCRSGP